MNIKHETIEKWFKKGDATEWEEMPRSAMECILNYLKSKNATTTILEEKNETVSNNQWISKRV